MDKMIIECSPSCYFLSLALTMWIIKDPKEILECPSIEIHYKFTNFERLFSLEPGGKISQGRYQTYTWQNIPLSSCAQ